MSMESPRSTPEPEKPASLLPVSRLNPGDMVLENGIPAAITAKMRSGNGITLKLDSGGFMTVDDENEEVEVPHTA